MPDISEMCYQLMAGRSQLITDAIVDTSSQLAETFATRADEVNNTLKSSGESLLLALRPARPLPIELRLLELAGTVERLVERDARVRREGIRGPRIHLVEEPVRDLHRAVDREEDVVRGRVAMNDAAQSTAIMQLVSARKRGTAR